MDTASPVKEKKRKIASQAGKQAGRQFCVCINRGVCSPVRLHSAPPPLSLILAAISLGPASLPPTYPLGPAILRMVLAFRCLSRWLY